MFPIGSKLLIGAAVLAAVSAFVYGVFADGTLGVIGLLSAALGLALVAGIVIAIQEADVDASDEVAVAAAPAGRYPAPSSMWPVIGAFGGGLVVLGLVTEPMVFILGIVVLGATVAEWMVTAWSEGASGELDRNREAHARMAGPLEYPVLAAVGAVVIIYSFSRIMLFLSKTGGVVAFSTIAFVVLIVGFAIAYRPTLRSGAVSAVCTVGALGLLAGGAVTGLEGEREMHHHETTGMLADDGECGTAEETHADDNASQTVAAKASIAGRLTLGSDGNLTAAVDGLGDGLDTITLPKSNPSNIMFTNDSGHDRRLVFELGDKPSATDDTATDDTATEDTATADTTAEGGESEGGEAAEGSAGEGEDEAAGPVRELCTALVEDGGSQLLTFEVDEPSSSVETPHRFVVPGVEGQTVEVVVP